MVDKTILVHLDRKFFYEQTKISNPIVLYNFFLVTKEQVFLFLSCRRPWTISKGDK